MSIDVTVRGEVVTTYSKSKDRKFRVQCEHDIHCMVYLDELDATKTPNVGDKVVCSGIISFPSKGAKGIPDLENKFYVRNTQIQKVESVEKFTFLGEEYTFTGAYMNIVLGPDHVILEVCKGSDGYTAGLEETPSGCWYSDTFDTAQEAVDDVLNDMTENFKRIANFLQYDVEDYV